MTLLSWIYANWSAIAPFLALILPFFVKLPFIAHSTMLEFFLKIFLNLLPGPASSVPVAPQPVDPNAPSPDDPSKLGSG